jgi:hypothetical protein
VLAGEKPPTGDCSTSAGPPHPLTPRQIAKGQTGTEHPEDDGLPTPQRCRNPQPREETGTGTFPRAVWVKQARYLYGAMLLSREGAFPCDELFCAVVHVNGVWLRVQGAGRFVRPTDRKASGSTRVSASGRSTTLPARPLRTLCDLLTRRTVSADRSTVQHLKHGPSRKASFSSRQCCPLLSLRAPVTGTPGACLFASLPFSDSSLFMRSITIGASNPSRPT